jgi:hypothetical protein
MGIFGFLQGGGRTQVVPAPPRAQEQANGHPPMSGFTGGYLLSPFRVRAPMLTERDTDNMVTSAGIQAFAYDPSVQRVPDTATQQNFNQKGLLPPVDVGVPIHGVFVQPATRQGTDTERYGGFVPPDMRSIATPPSHSPVILLSTPINVTTNVINGNPELLASNHGHPPLNIVKAADRKVPRVVGYGK